ncbi:hypothetical protein IW261DRAFT_1472982 [Armillaria novae-zelandiae]|uniref:Uncharacterized protein n=1 Tax=Armillaria novae-zelandiae TaxID=153914 RepID=A0AA39PCV0_9AGAR|nr:hypothetical protein IW261DRAFT_1472982 [Armillaria novae-zelandiae]
MAADPRPAKEDLPQTSASTPPLSSRNTNKLSLTLPDPRDSSAPLPPRAAPALDHPRHLARLRGQHPRLARLRKRGIKIVLNVTKEIASPFDASQPLRSFASAPDLKSPRPDTFYPAHHASGRPAMHYLKLMWSHGQQDLCGISRSATMIIALVMRAAERSPTGMQPAYDFVKQKSKWIGPNMSCVR